MAETKDLKSFKCGFESRRSYLLCYFLSEHLMTTTLVDIVSNLTTLDTSAARRAIVEGHVRVDGKVVDDPAARVNPPALVACGLLTFGVTE